MYISTYINGIYDDSFKRVTKVTVIAVNIGKTQYK